MHKCKCIFCKADFDRDKIAYVQVSERRYAHKECFDARLVETSKTESDYDKLVNYIEKLFGVGYVSARIAKQIKDFREQYGYTYSGILGTLIYWFDVRKATLDQANGGIGIVPYVYDQARDYYAKIDAANNINANVEYKPRTIEITITSPRPVEQKPKLFIFDDFDKEDN